MEVMSFRASTAFADSNSAILEVDLSRDEFQVG